MARVLEQSPVSHAALEPGQRRMKAEKVRRLVETVKSWEGARVLDIGTGAGVIAHTLAQSVGTQGEVHSLDVVDERVEREGYEFHLVGDPRLPFEDESFDIVISNHVIEHVGDESAQRLHVAEIRRVLSGAGALYLATATRWLVMEPHYHLPFLSWFPRPAASTYLRITGRGRDYDCYLPTHRWLRGVLAQAGFSWHEPILEAMRLMAEIEQPRGVTRLLLASPRPVFRLLRPVVPTIIFVAKKR